MGWKRGQAVRATRRITEGGDVTCGSTGAQFPEKDYIHAEKGDLGVVDGVDDGRPTVRFELKGTAVTVSGEPGAEVELVGNRFVTKLWAEYTQEEREEMVDTLLGMLRKYMIEPDTEINVRKSNPTHHGSAGEIRFSGTFELEIKVSGPLKPYCRICGNMGVVPMLDEPSKWPSCNCKSGKKRITKEGADE